MLNDNLVRMGVNMMKKRPNFRAIIEKKTKKGKPIPMGPDIIEGGGVMDAMPAPQMPMVRPQLYEYRDMEGNSYMLPTPPRGEGVVPEYPEMQPHEPGNPSFMDSMRSSGKRIRRGFGSMFR